MSTWGKVRSFQEQKNSNSKNLDRHKFPTYKATLILYDLNLKRALITNEAYVFFFHEKIRRSNWFHAMHEGLSFMISIHECRVYSWGFHVMEVLILRNLLPSLPSLAVIFLDWERQYVVSQIYSNIQLYLRQYCSCIKQCTESIPPSDICLWI